MAIRPTGGLHHHTVAFADCAYAGECVANAACTTVQIVRKSDDQIGFKVHKRRWVVEGSCAWIGRNRRFLRDVERLISAEAFLYAASSVILLRRMARC